jgi:purine catabolism regulator
MGISVSDCLGIGGLREAKVIAGQGGLDRMVTAVDLIDVPDAALWFRPGALVVSTLYVLKDNPKAQVKMLEDLVDAGCSGLVVFSPERYLDALDEGLVHRADQMDFPLLTMPDMSYVDVIVPVLSAILDKKVADLEYSQMVHRQMTDIILRGDGYQQIVDALSEMLRYPVELLDANLVPASRSGDFPVPKAPPPPAGVISDVRRSGHPCYYRPVEGDEAPKGHLLFPVTAGGRFHGLFIVSGLEDTLDPLYTVPLEAAGTAVSLEHMKDEAIRESERRAAQDLFDEILSGNVSGPVLDRARALGVDLSGRRAVVVVEAVPSENGRHRHPALSPAAPWERIDSIVRLECPQNASTLKRDRVIAFLKVNGASGVRPLAHRLEQRLADGLGPHAFAAGMSPVVFAEEQLCEAFQQAERALQIGLRLRGKGSVALYDDLQAFHVLERHVPREEREALYQGAFGPLLGRDAEDGGVLAETLEEYLLSGCRASATASRLYIHRNSLRYRLKKIESILGHDFLGEEKRVLYYLAAVSHRLSQ